jgi:hypothetical protein
MTGTINQMAGQAKSNEMLRQAAEARRVRSGAGPKRTRSWSPLALINRTPRAASAEPAAAGTNC